MTVCILDFLGRVLDNDSIRKLTQELFRQEGISDATVITGSSLNNPAVLREKLSTFSSELLIVLIIAFNDRVYRLEEPQVTELILELESAPESRTGEILERLFTTKWLPK